MKRSGRFNPFIVVGVICALLLVPLFLIGRRGPENYAADFLNALGDGDANRLAEVTVIGNHNFEERKKLWEESLANSKYYTFSWRISDVTKLDDDHSAVTIQERRNLQIRMGEDEDAHMITVIKTNDGWKVLIDGMDREIYPFLPRP